MLKTSVRTAVSFSVLFFAAGPAPSSDQARLEPFAALGLVHDALGRQESEFISFPAVGAGLLYRFSRVFSLGIEGEYARLGRFVSAMEVLPGDPFSQVWQKYHSTATSWRLGILARFRLSDRPMIPRLIFGAGYCRTAESAVPGVRSESISNGVTLNLGAGWRVASLGDRRQISLEGRWHLGVGEAAGEAAFTSYLTLGFWLKF